MKWVKSRNSYRNPKIYSTTPNNKQSFKVPSWLWLVLVIILVLGGIAWFLFYSDYFKVKNVEVTGSLNPSVKQEIESLHGENVILLSFGDIDKQIADQYSSIKNIKIYRGIPDTLKIEVEVREPKIFWETTEGEYYVDAEGVVFTLPGEDDLTDEEKANLIKITDTENVPIEEGLQILTDDFVDFMMELNEKFSEYSGANITKINIGATTFQIEVETDKGYRVILDTTRSLEPQLKGLKVVIMEHIDNIKEYIDMRVEGKAYYR